MLESVFIDEPESVKMSGSVTSSEIDSLIPAEPVYHITAAPYARPIILLPAQSASLLSQ